MPKELPKEMKLIIAMLILLDDGGRKRKRKDIDSTEIGKMFKELIAKPGDGENPYLSVMLRIDNFINIPLP